MAELIMTTKHHIDNMTANFGKTCMPWGPKRSVLAGCSGAFFFVPGVVGLDHGSSSRVMLLAFAVQSVLSVMSDYVATGRDSTWHGLDRWFASMLTAFMIYFAHSALSPWHCVIAVPPLACLHMSKRAIVRSDWNAYVRWHTLWWGAGAGEEQGGSVDAKYNNERLVMP